MKKILLLLVVLPLLLLTACIPSNDKSIKSDYDVAYITYGNQMLYLPNIEGYYFKYEGIIVVIDENGREYMTSKENVMFYGERNED